MKYISIDIETTGLNPEKHKVLSFGAIMEDTNNILPYEELPKFHVYIDHYELVGSAYALAMNCEILEVISGRKESDIEVIKPDELAPLFFDWLWKNHMRYDKPLDIASNVRFVDGESYPMINVKTKPIHVTVAGKNFGTFDKPFLEKMPWWQKLIRIRQRVIDPAILFTDWENDITLPNLETCKERSHFEKFVTHDALDDAWDVIRLCRVIYNRK
jgi:oligoribonuclease